MVLSASADRIELGLKGPRKSAFYVHQVSHWVVPRVALRAASYHLQFRFQAVAYKLLTCKSSRWCSSYVGITQHPRSQNNRPWQLRVGSCHCWWVKQVVWIKRANSRAEPCRQPALVYVWEQGSNWRGSTSGYRGLFMWLFWLPDGKE